MMSDNCLRRAFHNIALRAAAWPFRVAAARASMRTLAGMDDRELADIGLIRSDLRDVSALALDCDPTALLARRSRERQRDAFGAPNPLWADRLTADPQAGAPRSAIAGRGRSVPGAASTLWKAKPKPFWASREVSS